MAVQARPEPETPTSYELLVSTQSHAASTRELLRCLVADLQARSRPARISGVYRLGTSKPTDRDDSSVESPSVGVLNPNPVSIYLGIGGVAPRPGQEAIAVPPSAFLVLPLSVASFELGVDVTDPNLTADAVVHVFRFDSVQAAYMGTT